MADTNPVPTSEIIQDLGFEGEIKDAKQLKQESEKAFLERLGKKNKEYLVKLDPLERERIARHIKNLYEAAKEKHNEISDKIDQWDDTFRMVREPVEGTDEDTPDYKTPISTVTLEVVHANIMNVFFTPHKVMRVLPVEEGDMPKVNKIERFGNWSMANEFDLFTQTDKLFHASGKNGECPYKIHWVKEYGIDIKREIIPNPMNPAEPLIDPDTKEPLFREIEEPKLLYNAPKMEVFSRKDYIQPDNALMDKKPDWEMIRIRMTYDKYLREQKQGKMYPGTIKDIKDWGSGSSDDPNKEDYEGDVIPVGKWEKEFFEFYGRLRLKVIKDDAEDEIEEYEELEDEFIGIMNMDDEVLCSLRKNKFPLKERPTGMDYFVPDDEGRRAGLGIMELMESIQTGYDALFNQYIYGVIQSNSPFGFFSPLANQRDEKIKIKAGYLFPSSDPQGVNMIKIPPPNQSLQLIMELVRYWAQMLFGISDYASGLESKIDPSAPAKKAEIVVAQGNVRLNMIIKRKNKTLQNIFRKWFLLYKENMPPNKYMRIVGTSEDNPFKFEPVGLADFALKSIPDFELTGNILNVNKSFEANKALAVYNTLIVNPMFNPATRAGQMALHGLTKWLIDKLDEIGLERFLPQMEGDFVYTPEEENARFMQGDMRDPADGEDHVYHIRKHQEFINDPSVPLAIKQIAVEHVKLQVAKLKEQVTQQMVMQQAGVGQGGQPMPPQGGMNAGQGQGTPGAGAPMVNRQPAGVA